MDDIPRPLMELLKGIEQQLASAHALGLSETIFLLGMAHLDLKAKAYGISPEELRLFSDALSAQQESVSKRRLACCLGMPENLPRMLQSRIERFFRATDARRRRRRPKLSLHRG